uniref:Gamma-tubulin complex component 2 n=1 Tax=Spermophilus dauricus TaxID=99837 RepID=A0A8C9PZN5_SPEDA
MSEFRIHHDVNELLSLLRVHSGDGAEVYIDLLQKNRTPYVTTTVSAHSAKVSTSPCCRAISLMLVFLRSKLQNFLVLLKIF